MCVWGVLVEIGVLKFLSYRLAFFFIQAENFEYVINTVINIEEESKNM